MSQTSKSVRHKTKRTKKEYSQHELAVNRLMTSYFEFKQEGLEDKNDVLKDPLAGITINLSYKELYESNLYLAALFNKDYLRWFFGADVPEFEEDDSIVPGRIMETKVTFNSITFDMAELEAWQYHLYMMIKSDDPLIYISQYL